MLLDFLFDGEINIGVDVDGTLTEERLGEEIMFLTPRQIEKRYMECTLKKGVEILLNKSLKGLFAITGRREMYKEVTIDWFDMYGIPYRELVTVPNNFYPNGIFDLKKYIHFKIDAHKQRGIKYAFDDSIYVVDALNQNEINAFKVDGDFREAFEKMKNLHYYNNKNKRKC